MEKSLKKYFLIFAGPTLIAFLIAFIVPFFVGLYLSLNKFTTLTNTKWVGADNYIKAFASTSGFVHALGFTTIVSAISIVTVNLGAFCLAYLLTRKLRGTNIFRSVFFMPNFIGGIVLGGEIIAEGTPEHVASIKKSYTGKYLKRILFLLFSVPYVGTDGECDDG